MISGWDSKRMGILTTCSDREEENIEWGRECEWNRGIGVWKYLQGDNEEGELPRVRMRGTSREREKTIGRGWEKQRESGRESCVRQWKRLMGEKFFTFTLLTWICRSCSAPKTADGTWARERVFQLREKCLLALLVRERLEEHVSHILFVWRLSVASTFYFPTYLFSPFFSHSFRLFCWSLTLCRDQGAAVLGKQAFLDRFVPG